jgi:hypothetical protein
MASGESAGIDCPRFTAMLVTTPAMGARITVSRRASTCARPSRSSLICRESCSTCVRERSAMVGSSSFAPARSRSTCARWRLSVCSRISWSGDLVLLLLHERLGDELLLARQALVAIELLARRLDTHFLQLHLLVDLLQLVVEVLHAAAHLLDLLRAELAQLRLLLLQHLAPRAHLLRRCLARRRA